MGVSEVFDGWNRWAHCASEALLEFKINQIMFTSCSVSSPKKKRNVNRFCSDLQAHLLRLLSPRFLIPSFYFPPNMSCSSQLTSCSPYWLSYVPCKQPLLLFKENHLCLQMNRCEIKKEFSCFRFSLFGAVAAKLAKLFHPDALT